jgi:predicted amidophosphoribosyltransferase
VPVDSVLAKARETPPQAGLPAVDRRANLRGAFRLVRSGQGRILLVDDIYTTGSTVAECAHALKAGGYKEVFTLTVARA